MKYRVWDCQIVVPADAQLPEGFDFPPRLAATNAVEAAGIEVVVCFSGWGGSLTGVRQGICDDTRAARDAAGERS